MSEDQPTTVPEEKTKKKAPLAMIIGASLAAGGATAAAVYFLAPVTLFSQSKSVGAEAADSPKDNSKHGAAEAASHTQEADKNESHGEAGEKHREANDGTMNSESGSSKFHVTGGIGVFSPDPIVVSITPVGRVRYLKLGYVVETSPESGEVFIERQNRIKDTLNTYLRAINVAALEDPASMGRIREQIARRVAVVVDPAPVHSVLITDFILS